MFWKKVSSRLARVGASAVLMVGVMTPLIQTRAALAVACADALASTSSTGNLSLNAKMTSNIDTTVNKVSYEVTPQANWGANDQLVFDRLTLSDGACTPLADVYAYLDGTKELSIYFADTTRSSAFTSPTDYTNVMSGVTVTASTNTLASASYTIPAINASVSQLLSIDLSNTGWVDFYLKTGAGTDDLLVSFKAPTGLASFGSKVGLVYSPIENATSCKTVTGTSELLGRVLLDNSATALSVSKAGVCPSFGDPTYNSTTKTASLKYLTAGIAPDATIDKGAGTYEPGGGNLYFTKSLSVTSDNKSFNDGFSSSNSAAQQLYLTAYTTNDGKNITKETPYPVVGFIADMTTGDIDLSAKTVSLDVLDTAAKRAAFAHNVNTISKDGTFTLYVPFKDGDTFVGVCIGATSLVAVSDKCNGVYYLKDGQTKTSKDTKSIPAGKSVKASVVTVGAKKFWQVDGLTNTGAFGSTLASDPATGISVSSNSLTTAIAVIVLTLGLAVAARKLNESKK